MSENDLSAKAQAQEFVAAERLEMKARELAGRTRGVLQMLAEGQNDGLPFGFEMVRESISAVEFWLSQLEKAVSK